jgi:hypothetical protein
VLKQLALEGLRHELDVMVPLVKQVMKQTRARIFRGDTRAEGKILSLFEPSTEIIRKGKAAKPNEFGKMVKLQEAEDQIVIDYEVYDRRPSDSDLLIAAIETPERCWDAYRTWWQQTPHSTPPRTRPRPKPRASNASAFPIARPKAPSASVSSENAGSATAKSGAQDARTHQRHQASARSQPLPIQRQRWNEALGRPRRDRRQPHQHGSGQEKARHTISACPRSISPFNSPQVNPARLCLATVTGRNIENTQFCAGK